MLAEFLSPQFLKFLASGGIAAIVNFLSRMAFEYTLGINHPTSIILAYLVGMTVAFFLYKKHVFEPSRHHTAREALHFTIVNIFALAQTLGITLLLSELAFPFVGLHWFPKEIAHAIGISVPACTSYIGHKYFSFRV